MNLGMCYASWLRGEAVNTSVSFSFSEMAAGWSCCRLRRVASLVPEPTPHFTDNHWCLGDVRVNMLKVILISHYTAFLFLDHAWNMSLSKGFWYNAFYLFTRTASLESIHGAAVWFLTVSKKSSADFEKKSWEGQNTESYGYLLNLRVAVGKLWAKCVSKAI